MKYELYDAGAGNGYIIAEPKDRKNFIAIAPKYNNAKMICDILNRHFERVKASQEVFDIASAAFDTGDNKPTITCLGKISEYTPRNLQEFLLFTNSVRREKEAQKSEAENSEKADKKPLSKIDIMIEKAKAALMEKEDPFVAILNAARKANDNCEIIESLPVNFDKTLKEIIKIILKHYQPTISAITVDQSGCTRVEFDTTTKPA